MRYGNFVLKSKSKRVIYRVFVSNEMTLARFDSTIGTNEKSRRQDWRRLFSCSWWRRGRIELAGEHCSLCTPKSFWLFRWQTNHLLLRPGLLSFQLDSRGWVRSPALYSLNPFCISFFLYRHAILGSLNPPGPRDAMMRNASAITMIAATAGPMYHARIFHRR